MGESQSGLAKEFKKQRQDKHNIRHDLIPPEVLKEIATVLGTGCRKEGRVANSWRMLSEDGKSSIVGDTYSSIMASKGRHYNDWLNGEIYDKDSGKHNLAHELCNTIFLLCYELNDMRGLDDRYKKD